jgi:uncharacterized protein DUF3551
MIRAIFWMLLVIAGIGEGPADAQSAVSQYPFCIQGEDNPGWTGCSFDTLQACQAAASGTFAECLANPWYQSVPSNVTRDPDGNQIGANAPLPVGPPPN